LKSETEKFPGALRTYCVEAMMQDKKALQAGTSHNLGQNFARAFEIMYLDRENERQYVYTTSWGVSTRMIGGLLMTHSDDDGLVLPPRIAPIKAVVIPLWKNDEEKSQVLPFAEKILAALGEATDPLAVRMDTRVEQRPADRFFHWVQQGIPLRVEVGPRDVEGGAAMVVRRDNRDKKSIPLESMTAEVKKILESMQKDLYQKAKTFREENTHQVDDYETFKEIMAGEGGFIEAHWNGSAEVEQKIKEETKATIRLIPMDDKAEPGKCILTGEPSARRVVFAQSY